MPKPSSPEAADPEERNDAGWLTRARTSALVLIVTTALALYLCWKLTQPFVPALAWALALAIIGYRLHQWLARRISHRNVSAGLATAALIVFIAVPIAATAPSVASKVKEGWENLRSESVQSRINKAMRSNPTFAPLVSLVVRHSPTGEELSKRFAPGLSRLVTGSLWAGMSS